MNLSRFLHLRLQGASIDTPVFNGKDSGGQAPTQQTVTNTNLPEYAQPYFTRLLDRAEATSAQPYASYTGARLQPLSQNQNLAISDARGLSSLPQSINNGQNFLTTSGIGGLNTAQGFNPGNVGGWMNPYQQGVIDIAKREANRGYDIQDMTRRADPNSVSALGGYRDAIMSAENDRNRGIALNDIQTQGSAAAYDRAVQAMGQQTQFGLGAYQNLGSTGQGLVNAGATQEELGRENVADLERTGALEQGQGQKALDIGYSDFRNAYDFPRQQLNFMSGILRGVPVQPGSDISTYQQPPNPYSQLLGLGIAGAGVSKLMS